MGTVISLADFKRRRNPEILFVGDWVEWRDWNGDFHGKIKGIGKVNTAYACTDSVFLWEKNDYWMELSNGLTIAGFAITGKVIK